ncbi:hypothetical protein F1880_005546 [Penicillium rolfsii]|nr:hypothetical protein F1880_005546 [Penicillium rolfsii]
MLSLPFLTPQDSHELWFGASQPYRSFSPQQPGHDASNQHPNRRNNVSAPASHRAFLPSRAPNNSLAALNAEERALRLRKHNIASFGYSWIRPAGCAKTMLGMKEEEAEREEALAALAAEQQAAAAVDPDDVGMTMGEEGEEEEGMERDLDADIPEADEGLVEEGEEGLEEDGLGDEEGFMERDLDDDIPEGYSHDDYEEESGLYEEEVDEDFDNQPDLDADIPEAGGSDDLSRDLDDDIPDAAEDGSEQEGEWQHTDTEDELDDEDEDDDQRSVTRPRMENFRTSTPNSRGFPPPFMRRDVQGETEAQRRFINRWSGGGDAFDSSSMMFEEEDLRASITSQSSRRSGFGRHYPRRVGGPRDSLN